ncbi:hypothetical protein [Nocardia sp. NPDC051981]|uniref:hypothetical protein n=1 Tax=Nocardia sp. NPDC051981 TaxID=3155417 RepID=UPI003426BBCA
MTITEGSLLLWFAKFGHLTFQQCEKCIRAQDERDPLGTRHRALGRILAARIKPLWPVPDDDGDLPRWVCIDCPACGQHVRADDGEEWCFICRWQLKQVEDHVGPPVETGFKIDDRLNSRSLLLHHAIGRNRANGIRSGRIGPGS